VRHMDKRAVDIFTREIAPAATGMAQGISGFAGGRPSVQPVLRLYSFLLDKARVKIEVDFEGKRIPISVMTEGQAVPGYQPKAAAPVSAPAGDAPAGDVLTVPLIELAHGRSGDKGNDANIGIIARQADFVPLLRERLTAAVVGDYFRHLCRGRVTRYELPGIGAFNFLLDDALGGGGVLSLRNDPQGKCFAQMLLDLPLAVPRALAATLPPPEPD